MKKFLLIILLVSSIIFTSNSVFAATATPTDDTTPTTKPTPTSASTTPKDTQIEKIKDLVASHVAELDLVDHRGLIGYVKSTTNTQIVITDQKNLQVKVDIDELTKFNSPDDKSSFGISDIKNGDLLSLVGLYNKQTERLLARFVEVASNIPQNIEGVVLDKNTTDYTIDVATADGKKTLVNVETSTKTATYEDGETTKSGFSKIENGQRIIVVGFADKTEKDQINASRILVLPGMKLSSELTKSAAANVQGSETSASPTAKPKP